MMVSKRNLLFQGAIFRFHVKFWEGIQNQLLLVVLSTCLVDFFTTRKSVKMKPFWHILTRALWTTVFLFNHQWDLFCDPVAGGVILQKSTSSIHTHRIHVWYVHLPFKPSKPSSIHVVGKCNTIVPMVWDKGWGENFRRLPPWKLPPALGYPQWHFSFGTTGAWTSGGACSSCCRGAVVSSMTNSQPTGNFGWKEVGTLGRRLRYTITWISYEVTE